MGLNNKQEKYSTRNMFDNVTLLLKHHLEKKELSRWNQNNIDGIT